MIPFRWLSHTIDGVKCAKFTEKDPVARDTVLVGPGHRNGYLV